MSATRLLSKFDAEGEEHKRRWRVREGNAFSLTYGCACARGTLGFVLYASPHERSHVRLCLGPQCLPRGQVESPSSCLHPSLLSTVSHEGSRPKHRSLYSCRISVAAIARRCQRDEVVKKKQEEANGQRVAKPGTEASWLSGSNGVHAEVVPGYIGFVLLLLGGDVD